MNRATKAVSVLGLSLMIVLITSALSQTQTNATKTAEQLTAAIHQTISNRVEHIDHRMVTYAGLPRTNRWGAPRSPLFLDGAFLAKHPEITIEDMHANLKSALSRTNGGLLTAEQKRVLRPQWDAEIHDMLKTNWVIFYSNESDYITKVKAVDRPRLAVARWPSD